MPRGQRKRWRWEVCTLVWGVRVRWLVVEGKKKKYWKERSQEILWEKEGGGKAEWGRCWLWFEGIMVGEVQPPKRKKRGEGWVYYICSICLCMVCWCVWMCRWVCVVELKWGGGILAFNFWVKKDANKSGKEGWEGETMIRNKKKNKQTAATKLLKNCVLVCSFFWLFFFLHALLLFFLKSLCGEKGLHRELCNLPITL